MKRGADDRLARPSSPRETAATAPERAQAAALVPRFETGHYPPAMTPFRRALVTGASTGIGAAFADRLARDGCDLVLVARSRDRLDVLAEHLRRDHRIAATVLPADLTRREELRRVEDEVARDEALDLLVNNAGFGTLGRFAGLEIDAEIAEIQLNVIALVRLTRAALPSMLNRERGAIVNVSSLAAFAPGPYNATYSATKAYVKSFSEALSEELRGTGVCVQTLCPGFTHTEFQARAGLDTSRIPSAAWMEVGEVVEKSLAALRQGRVVCVPGLGNRLVGALGGLFPGSLVRRIVGSAAKRLVG
jgi:short-subunit dehydrogenase